MILIETVGAGQSEVDIARLAHTVVVVEAPGLGDDIQAIKAGILEIADILVVNKCDLPGAEQTARVLKAMFEMAHPVRHSLPGGFERPIWLTPVVMACSTGCQGVLEIVDTIREHFQFINRTGERQQRDRERLEKNMDALLRDTLMLLWKRELPEGIMEETLEALIRRDISPFQAVEKLLELKTQVG